MRGDRNHPFWKKFRIMMSRDFFPWVLASGCFQDGDDPYLHVEGCKRDCEKICNDRGHVMGKLIKRWKDGPGPGCVPKSWFGKKPRFRFDDPN